MIFARTATRATEIGVRSALGASRARIAGQLFAEGLVLCSLSAGIGLFVAYYGLKWVKGMLFIAQHMPPAFWWNDTLSTETVLYATTLAVLGAIIIGVIPAWKSTGPQVQEGLKQAASRGLGGLKTAGCVAIRSTADSTGSNRGHGFDAVQCILQPGVILGMTLAVLAERVDAIDGGRHRPRSWRESTRTVRPLRRQ